MKNLIYNQPLIYVLLVSIDALLLYVILMSLLK